MNECHYCEKIIYFFPAIPQGSINKYHKRCMHKYMEIAFGFGMELALKLNKSVLINL